jgi:hypothetical protein
VTVKTYHANLPPKGHPNRNGVALLQNFFEGVSLEVRTRGFAVVRLPLIAALFKEADQAPEVSRLQALARRRDLSATLRGSRTRVVFRRRWRGYEFPVGETADTWQRASGEAFCDLCRFQFREHPADEAEPTTLRVLCSGRRVKL